jgi:hypothetical protein
MEINIDQIAIDLLKSIEKDNEFTSDGKIECSSDVNFLYKKDNGDFENIGKFGNLNLNNINKFAKKSCFGNMVKMADEYDDKVRISKEINMDDVFMYSLSEKYFKNTI